MQKVDTLPIFPDPLRTFSFHPENNHWLVIAFASNAFVIYDAKEKKLAPFSRVVENQTPPESVARKNHRILGITFNPKNANQILMWAETFFVSYDITKVEFIYSDKLIG